MCVHAFVCLCGRQPKSPSYLAQLSDEIVKESMRRGSRDNITALVVRLAAAPEERRALVF
jgi:serine/threonine protein phosphatase PrpC